MAQINLNGLTDEQKNELIELKGEETWSDFVGGVLARSREEAALSREPSDKEAAVKLDQALARIRDLFVGEWAGKANLVDSLTDRWARERRELEELKADAEARYEEARNDLAAATEKATHVDELEERVAKAEKERAEAVEQAKEAAAELTDAKADAADALKKLTDLQEEAARGRDALARVEAMKSQIADLQASVKDARQERDGAKAELKSLRERMGE